MPLTSLEERRRRSRNIVVAAFALLVAIWTVKLAFPQSTRLSAFSTPDVEVAPETPAKEAPAMKDPLWKARPGLDVVGMPEDSFNGTVSSKAAVIIEPQFRNNLIPLILHFSSVLGPTWPILIYTAAESVSMFATSAALARYVKEGVVQLRVLPQAVLLTNSDELSEFMADTWLWEGLAPAENILIFQSDSIICANAARSVDEFVEYDIIGVPTVKDKEVAKYNGGLSLRKRSMILRVLENWDWKATKTKEDQFEDQWYLHRMAELQLEDAEADIEVKRNVTIKLPTKEIAHTFSVNTIDYPHPLGIHQAHRWLKDETPTLDEWCPEYKLCSVSSIVNSPAPG